MTPKRTNIRVVVVDDSAFMRKAISTMLGEEPDIEVVAQGSNGLEGLRLATDLKPDVMTLDIEMPTMDGLTALGRIMSEAPTHVIMVSSLTTEGSHAALTAMKLGAAHALAKDASKISLDIVKIKEELVSLVRALGRARKPAARGQVARPGARHTVSSTPTFQPGRFDVICIGSSTGGPPILETIIGGLPAQLSTPVVIAQHMPELFTRSMTDRLAKICKLKVAHISDGMPMLPGTVFICPGGMNTHFKRTAPGRASFIVNRDPPDTIYFPSANVLFQSAAECFGGRALAAVLTGMGEDGCKGAGYLKSKGGIVLAQNEETSVVYGMPRAVVQAGIAQAALYPEGILAAIASIASPAAPNGMRLAG